MKRPTGITLLSLLLGWLAIVGMVNAWFIFSGDFPHLDPVLGFVALMYAASALSSCIGLWQMKSWAPRALHSWMVICLLIFAGFALGFDDFMRGGIPGIIGFAVFIGLFFLGIHRYVQSTLGGETNA